MDHNENNIFWFVLFAPNGKIRKVKSYLEEEGIEFFFPMYYIEKKDSKTNTYKKTLHPVISNLIFVRSSRIILDNLIKEIKLKLNYTSDLYYRDKGSKKIIVVPDDQMINFIRIAGKPEEQIMYLSNEEVDLRKGAKVRIIGGVFNGTEGILMRVKGNKRVIVSIPNLFAVATAYLPAQFIEVIG